MAWIDAHVDCAAVERLDFPIVSGCFLWVRFVLSRMIRRRDLIVRSVRFSVLLDVIKLLGGERLNLLHNVEFDALRARWGRERAFVMVEIGRVDVVEELSKVNQWVVLGVICIISIIE